MKSLNNGLNSLQKDCIPRYFGHGMVASPIYLNYLIMEYIDYQLEDYLRQDDSQKDIGQILW